MVSTVDFGHTPDRHHGAMASRSHSLKMMCRGVSTSSTTLNSMSAPLLLLCYSSLLLPYAPLLAEFENAHDQLEAIGAWESAVPPLLTFLTCPVWHRKRQHVGPAGFL